MSRPAAPLVLLDRDGVINRDSDEYVKSVAEWHPLPGSLAAIARLTAAGFRIAVVSNQSGIGRGLFTEATLGDIHAAMRDAVTRAGGLLHGIYYCPHRPDENCACRKPRPGLLLRAAEELDARIGEATFIGDKLTDVEAALAAGARPVLVGALVADGAPTGIETYADLPTAADALIAERERSA